MRPLLFLVLSALSALAAPSSARAAMMEHTDLAGLAYDSELVVVAQRGAVTHVTQYETTTAFRVQRVLAGNVAVGATLSVSDDGYVTTGASFGGVTLASVDPTVILFLTQPPPASGRPPGWILVPSGLRVLSGGKVYRFEQLCNPGPYVPVPQAHDPEDARGEVADPLAVDVPAFETMVRAAVARATALHQALALTDPATRRARAMALLAAPPDRFATAVTGGFYEDVLAERTAAALAAAGDVDGALDAQGHSHGGHYWPDIATPVLVAHAADGTAPVPVRTAALQSLVMADFTPADERTIADVARSAAAPEVRAAAIDFFATLSGRSDSGGRAAHLRRRGVARATLDAVLAHEADARVIGRARIAANDWGFATPHAHGHAAHP